MVRKEKNWFICLILTHSKDSYKNSKGLLKTEGR